eukprot:752342-Hanusia_phi.AAC.2
MAAVEDLESFTEFMAFIDSWRRFEKEDKLKIWKTFDENGGRSLYSKDFAAFSQSLKKDRENHPAARDNTGTPPQTLTFPPEEPQSTSSTT